MLIAALVLLATSCVAAAFVAGLWLSDSEWLVCSDGHAPLERRGRRYWVVDADNPDACAALLHTLENLHGQHESAAMIERLRERIGPP